MRSRLKSGGGAVRWLFMLGLCLTMLTLSAGPATLAAGSATLAAGPATLAADSATLAAGPAPVTPKVELDRKVILPGKKRPVYVLIEFDVPERKSKPGKERPRMNLALVIDRSGSMSQRGKITYARKAAKVVVDLLSPKDRLAVIEYDDRITVLWPSTPVEAPEMIKRLIDGLNPRGSTDLAGGMMKGVEETLKHLDKEGVNRVLLMSDGLANRGVTRPAAIRQLVREALRKGVSISTAGLGLNYDEDLMQTIAENGAGNYYYIENPARMSRIFRRELSTLYATVAKDARLVFTAGPAVEKVTVFGYAHTRKGGSTTIPMGNFHSGEKRSVVLRLEVNAAREGGLDLGRLELHYVDTLDNRPGSHATALKVRVSPDTQVVLASRNKKVMAEAILTETDQRYSKAIRMYEKGRRVEAKRGIAALANELAAKNKTLNNLVLSKKLEALRMEASQMDRAAASPAARSRFPKSSKQRLYYSKRGKRGKTFLKEGDRGLEVERLQEALRTRKLYAGPANGRFSPKVTLAVKEFQKRRNLTPDGVAGPRTLRALGLY